jgi:SAM-dependent methyltransferase
MVVRAMHSLHLQQSTRARTAADWAALGATAVDTANLRKARKCFVAAVKADSNNATYRFSLALVLEALGEIGLAAEQLTIALRFAPTMTAASRRLCWLLDRGTLPADVRLNDEGLLAALAHDTADRDLLAAAILHDRLRNGPLRQALDEGRSRGWLDVARGLCVSATGEALRDRLFLETLGRGVVTNPQIEQLLTALRFVLLLEVPRARFADRALTRLAAMLVQQCWLNEFVWPETAEEIDALGAQGISRGLVLEGDPECSHALFLRSMYRSPAETLGQEIQANDLAKLEPAPLREVLLERLAEEIDVRGHAARISRIGVISDETSVKVADMYDTSPYPRWTSVLTYRKGHYLKKLSSVFEPVELDFLQRPFEVLIAGCGTGRQAVSAAFDYGANARVTAFDIALPSLGYASRMARRMGASNVSFLHADIQQIETCAPSLLDRFHVIECTGVLHHMARPLDGWRALHKCLAPGGLMLVGLYSASARRNLAVLKADPNYPGPGCDADALRRYRQYLLTLPKGAPGSEFRRGMDFYSSSGFRDFFLHVSEHCFTLPEIKNFLDQHGLRFRGFFDLPFQLLQEHTPGAKWPGTLDQWAMCETDRSDVFPSMYQFWCTAA